MSIISTGNSSLDQNIISFFLTILATFVARWAQPRARICYFSPHEAIFLTPTKDNQNAQIRTQSLRVENTGRGTATNVEVHLAFQPENFKVLPTLSYTTNTTPQNSFVITVPNLGPKEGFWVEMITAHVLPVITNVRSDAGPARSILVKPQTILPKWVNAILYVLLFLGLFTVFSTALNVMFKLF